MRGRIPFLFVLLAAMLWGTTGTAQTLAPANAHPVSIGTMRMAIGGVFLIILTLFLKQFHLKNWPLKSLLVAIISMACYQPLFFSAVKTTGVAIGTVIAIGSAPILSGVLEGIFLKQLPKRKWWVATCFSILGCIMLFVNATTIHLDPIGMFLALGAGLSFASYTLVSKRLVQVHKPLTVVAVVFTGSGLLLFPFLFIYDLSWVFTGNGIIVSLHLGIVATGIAYFLFVKGLIEVPSSSAVTLSLAEPMTATVLGVLIVGEQLTVFSWIGLALLVCGLVCLAVPKEAKLVKPS